MRRGIRPSGNQSIENEYRRMQPKIWVMSQLYYPEETSTGYLLTRIAEGIAKHYPVHVLCGQPSYSARGVGAPRREMRNGVDIRRCLSTTWNKNVLLFKLVNFATISISIFFNAIWRLSKRDIVVVVTNPPTLPFLIALACWLRRARCVLLIHDVYPEVLVAVGKSRPTSLGIRFMAYLTKRLYGAAERIIVLGRDMKRLAEKKLSSDHDRVIVIPNWADIDEITPGDHQSNFLLQELGLQSKFVLQYAGNMGYPNDLESIIESADLLRDRPGIHFLFIGSGTKKAWLDEQVKNRQLANVTVLPNQPRSQQQTFLNACDVSLISLVAGMAGVGVPSRTYNAMAVGKPIIVIADRESEVTQVVNEEQVGWALLPHQPETLANTILAAESQPELRQEMGIRARAVAERKYSFDVVIEAYLTLLRQMADSHT